MTLQQLIDDLTRLLPHDANSDVFISVPDRVAPYQADWAHITTKGVVIVASEDSGTTKRTRLSR